RKRARKQNRKLAKKLSVKRKRKRHVRPKRKRNAKLPKPRKQKKRRPRKLLRKKPPLRRPPPKNAKPCGLPCAVMFPAWQVSPGGRPTAIRRAAVPTQAMAHRWPRVSATGSNIPHHHARAARIR